jgi:hypothetical protein
LTDTDAQQRGKSLAAMLSHLLLPESQPFKAKLGGWFKVPKFIKVFELVELSVPISKGEKSIQVDLIDFCQRGIACIRDSG